MYLASPEMVTSPPQLFNKKKQAFCLFKDNFDQSSSSSTVSQIAEAAQPSLFSIILFYVASSIFINLIDNIYFVWV